MRPFRVILFLKLEKQLKKVFLDFYSSVLVGFFWFINRVSNTFSQTSYIFCLIDDSSFFDDFRSNDIFTGIRNFFLVNL
jgi:hypothetical protein